MITPFCSRPIDAGKRMTSSRTKKLSLMSSPLYTFLFSTTVHQSRQVRRAKQQQQQHLQHPTSQADCSPQLHLPPPHHPQPPPWAPPHQNGHKSSKPCNSTPAPSRTQRPNLAPSQSTKPHPSPSTTRRTARASSASKNSATSTPAS